MVVFSKLWLFFFKNVEEFIIIKRFIELRVFVKFFSKFDIVKF